jgi:zinc transport system substrate-binding protein
MRNILFLFLIFLASCFAPSNHSSKPVVLVTIPPYGYFVEQIAGDAVSLEIFVPAGASPHDYEPTPKQVEKFIGAKLWFRYGETGEQRLLPYLREKHLKDVDLSEGIHLLSSTEHACGHHHHEGKDLHFWLDPEIALKQCQTITRELSKLLPEHQEQFKQNFEKLAVRLKALDENIHHKLKPLQRSYLLLSHPALGYYCKRYDLHQLSVECEGKEPLPQQVAKVVKEAKDNHVKVIFTEPQYNNKGASLIAEKLQLPIYEINPYARDYFKTMNEITESIVEYYGN